MSAESDAELLRILAREVALDGGVAELSVLPTYDPKIRRLLGDRKLWAFVSAHPRYFQCRERKGAEGSTSELTVRLLEPPPQPAPSAPATEPPGGWRHQCGGCGLGFGSRNALFKHLRSDASCQVAAKHHSDASTIDPTKSAPGGGSQNSRSSDDSFGDSPLARLSNAGKALVLAVQGVLRGDRLAAVSAGGAIPLSWVVSPAKSRSALRKYVRESGALAAAAKLCPPVMKDGDVATAQDEGDQYGSLQPFRRRWWLVAMQCLHTLLVSLPTLFELSVGAGSPLDPSELRACTVKEVTHPKTMATTSAEVALSAATVGNAVALRVVQLLEWHEIRSGVQAREPGKRGAPVTLGVLARDKGLQKHLGSRQLLPLLQAQCCGDNGDAPPFVLLHEDRRGWCAQLRPDYVATTAQASGSLVPVAPTAGGMSSTNAEAGAGDGGDSAEDHADDGSDGAACVDKRPIVVLAVLSGAVVVDKPCGVSTEEVVDWLQHSPPSAVKAEMDSLSTRHKADQATQNQPDEREPQACGIGGDDESKLSTAPSELHCDQSYTLESVSRLDKPTSGVLVIPLSRHAAVNLTEQWRNRTVEKTYICLCSDRIEPTMGAFDTKLRTLNRGRGSKTLPHPQGKEAHTEYRRLRVYSTKKQDPAQEDDQGTEASQQSELFSLCEVYPRTGRTHQIRAHFGAAGYPLVGDVKYGGPVLARMCTEDRLFLHSARLRFRLPSAKHGGDCSSNDVQHDVSAALPLELQQVLSGLTVVH